VHISGFYICLPNKEDNQLIQLAELDFETKFNTTKFSNNDDDDDDYFSESTSVNKKYHISSQSEAEFSNGSIRLSNTSTDTQRKDKKNIKN
jgi:hypothetical protein